MAATFDISWAAGTRKEEIMTKQQEEDSPIQNLKKRVGRRTFSASRLFWGLFVILIGVLALGDNFGFLNVKWANLWQLWPLIIIAIGLSLLSFRSVVGRIVSYCLVVAAIIVVAWSLVWGGQNLVTIARDVAINSSSQNVKQVDVSLKTGAGSVKITSANQTPLAKIDFRSSSLNLEQGNYVDGSTQKIDLSTVPIVGAWDSMDVKNNWDISLTRKLPVTLRTDLGASNADIDLSHVKLQSLDAKVGASNFNLKIGDLQTMAVVNLSGGASSIKINIPQNSGIKVTLDSSLASKKLADLANVSGNLYQSPNYDTASNQIMVTASIGISSIDIERY